MRHIAEAARTTPVFHETEVLVVGGGPGGLAAAVAAARAGARTTLVDRYGCFGGVITQVGVDTIAWYRREETVDLEGIGREFERRAEAFGAGTPDVQSQSLALDSELFKVVADRMVLEAGVEPLLHCLVTEPIVEGGRVRGVITESKSGRQAILAQKVIDATGDADVAFRAGASCRTRPRGSFMGVTVMFSCSRVDKARFLDYVAESAPTYGDWGKCWHVTTDGKEDGLFSPYLQEPFDRARAGRSDPQGHPEHRRHLGTHHRRGRGHVPQPRRHGRLRLHRRAPADRRRDRRPPAGAAGAGGAAALHARVRARDPARVRRPPWAPATHARSWAGTS